jgi:hypothetical protein
MVCPDKYLASDPKEAITESRLSARYPVLVGFNSRYYGSVIYVCIPSPQAMY